MFYGCQPLLDFCVTTACRYVPNVIIMMQAWFRKASNNEEVQLVLHHFLLCLQQKGRFFFPHFQFFGW